MPQPPLLFQEGSCLPKGRVFTRVTFDLGLDRLASACCSGSASEPAAGRGRLEGRLCDYSCRNIPAHSIRKDGESGNENC
jgi:hypothetical protein